MSIEEKSIYSLDSDDPEEESGAGVEEGEELEDHLLFHHFYGF